MRPIRVLPIAVSLWILVTFLNPRRSWCKSGAVRSPSPPRPPRHYVSGTPGSIAWFETAGFSFGRCAKIRSSTDEPTKRLGQYYEDVPVFGGDIARQLDRGLTVSIYGTAYTDIDLDTTAALSHEEATGSSKHF